MSSTMNSSKTEELFRELWREYEDFRTVSHAWPKHRFIATQINVPDPNYLSTLLYEDVDIFLKTLRNPSGPLCGENGAATEDTGRIIQHVTMIALAKGFEYDVLRPHEAVEEGYENGADDVVARLPRPTVTTMGSIDMPYLREPLVLAGHVYKITGSEPGKVLLATLQRFRKFRKEV